MWRVSRSVCSRVSSRSHVARCKSAVPAIRNLGQPVRSPSAQKCFEFESTAAPTAESVSRKEEHARRGEAQRAAKAKRAAEKRRAHKEHVAAMKESRLQREKQRRLELEKQREARVRSAERDRRATLRKNAAAVIPHVLGRDPQCFEWTMSALDLNASFALSDSKKSTSLMTLGAAGAHRGENSLLSRHLQFYLDSIPTFATLLADQPQTLDRYFHATSNTKTEQLLDDLVQGGFSDPLFAKLHRATESNKARYAGHLQHIDTKTKQLQFRNDHVKQIRAELRDMESRLAVADSEIVQEEMKESKPRAEKKMQDDSSTALQTFGKSVLNFFSSRTISDTAESTITQNPEPPGMSMRQDQQMRIEKLRNQLKQAEQALDVTTKKLQHLKSELDSFEQFLSDSEYNAADVVLKRVMRNLCPAFAAHIHERHTQMIQQYRTLNAQTDLTQPHEWYLHARFDRRKIIFHGGPTNSGKTYSALQRLKKANKGLYLGPLRLLAAEVYETLTSQGLYTNLFTGQEVREIAFSTHAAATVEMAPLDRDFDIVVIDEIQMISDPFRGFAWTRALLGLRCKEIHVCGGMEAKQIVKTIADFCGDQFEVHAYTRFSELTVADKSLASKSNTVGSYGAVQPGDCVVAFSRKDIFAIKREIERLTRFKCCVVYGSLPPATRLDQARRFNDPNSGYDILVASDAIGMGLNLNIRRIIFNSMFKFDGEKTIQLDHSSVKQIGGRAGRRNSPFPNGEVTCRDPVDMEHLTKCMTTEIKPLDRAGLLPMSTQIEHFCAALQHCNLEQGVANLHSTLYQFSEMATLQGDFFLCKQTHLGTIAKAVDEFPLSVKEKYDFCMAPVNSSNDRSMSMLVKFAQKHAVGEASGLSRSVIPKQAKSFDGLSLLCSIYNQLELFLWLQRRFPGNLVEQQAAIALKEHTMSYIDIGLAESEKLTLQHCYIESDTDRRLEWSKTNPDVEFARSVDQYDDFFPVSDEI